MICLFGPDGSGKTTLARLLALYLRLRGYSVCVVWVRASHSVAFVLYRFFRLFRSFRGACNPFHGVCIPSRLRRVWLFIEFVSIIPAVLVKFVALRVFGCFVVGERGLIDLPVWLAVSLRDYRVLWSVFSRASIALSRLLCVNIYVRAELDALLSRRRGYPEAYTIPLQLKLYDLISRAYSQPSVDTTCNNIYSSLREVVEIARRRVRNLV